MVQQTTKRFYFHGMGSYNWSCDLVDYMKKLTASLLMTLSATALADVSVGVGEAKDCEVAKAFAIKDAMEKFAVREFSVNKRQVCIEHNANGVDCAYYRQIETDSLAMLKKVVSHEQELNSDSCFVEVKIEVEKARDILGDVIAKDSYKEGEQFAFDIVTKEPLYVYIFNMYYGSQISMLFPTELNRDNKVNGRLKLPQYMNLVADPLPLGVSKSKETLMVVFTRHKLTFKRPLTGKDIFETISSVPRYSRKIVYHNFVIERR